MHLLKRCSIKRDALILGARELRIVYRVHR
jgi:hypothetical protein